MKLGMISGIAVLLVSSSAYGFTRPIDGEFARERFVRDVLRDAAMKRALRTNAPSAPPLEDTGGLDYQNLKLDVTVDPSTGVVNAIADIEVRSVGKPMSVVPVLIDAGLHATAAETTGRTVSISEDDYDPQKLVSLTLSPQPSAGETITIRVSYSGTVKCGSYPGGGAICRTQNTFSHFAIGSIFPLPTDMDSPSAFDTMTRDVTLRVPAGTGVVVSANKVSETEENGTKISKWAVPNGLVRYLGFYAFLGAPGTMDVADTQQPTTLVFPTPQTVNDPKLRGWSRGVLEYVTKQAGKPLPFANLSLVRLPRELKDPGTATYAMTLLSENYSGAGDVLYEETWAHENSHLFWGILVPGADVVRSRLLTEGLATLTEIDYSYAPHFADVDRDLYLARRYRAIDVELRYDKALRSLPPIVVDNEQRVPSAQHAYSAWAYEKTSATLDHLRAGIGDDVFAEGLKIYAAACMYVGCVADDLRKSMEKASGQDLAPFFARWVTGTGRGKLTVARSGNEVTLTQDKDSAVPLELWITLDDGKLVKKRVRLEHLSQKVQLDGPVRTVRLNPRHHVMMDVVSDVEGDWDIDGEVDGNDLLECLPLVSANVPAQSLGLWTVDERFEPRCDVDQNGRIDDADIQTIIDRFATLRQP